MNNKLIIILVAVLLIVVGLSGCNEHAEIKKESEPNKSTFSLIDVEPTI